MDSGADCFSEVQLISSVRKLGHFHADDSLSSEQFTASEEADYLYDLAV